MGLLLSQGTGVRVPVGVLPKSTDPSAATADGQSYLFRFNAQFAQLRGKPLGAFFRGDGAFAFCLGKSLISLGLLDPLRKSQEPCSVGAEDPQVIGAFSRIESDLKSGTDETRHIGDQNQAISRANQPSKGPLSGS